MFKKKTELNWTNMKKGKRIIMCDFVYLCYFVIYTREANVSRTMPCRTYVVCALHQSSTMVYFSAARGLPRNSERKRRQLRTHVQPTTIWRHHNAEGIWKLKFADLVNVFDFPPFSLIIFPSNVFIHSVITLFLLRRCHI